MATTAEGVKQIISDLSGLAFNQIEDDHFLAEDIDLDSLDLITLAMKLEDEFHIQIPDDEVDDPMLGTVAGLIQHVQGKVKERQEKFDQFHRNIADMAGETVTSPGLQQRVKTAIERADMTGGTAIA